MRRCGSATSKGSYGAIHSGSSMLASARHPHEQLQRDRRAESANGHRNTGAPATGLPSATTPRDLTGLVGHRDPDPGWEARFDEYIKSIGRAFGFRGTARSIAQAGYGIDKLARGNACAK